MKAILVALDYKEYEDFETSLEELKGLCVACDIEYTHVVTQSIEPTKPYYMGKGKVEEIKLLIDDEELLIVNEELSPLQIRNLEDALGIEVTDRTDLILKIFASRAQSKEARLQVKIARLNYELPKLQGMHQGIYHDQGGSGFRGSGETQIELDRRRIHEQITLAKKELKRVKKERQIQRHHRNEQIVSLVGYTNSGKSTLMNLFTHKKVEAKDMLFATLETSTRKVKLSNNQNILLTDTVGFISHLPTHLVEAFLSTLEEVKEADLILLVIDTPLGSKQIEVTLETLKKLGVENTPILYVYNKMDLVNDFIVPEEPYVYISAKNKTNINELENKIVDILNRNNETVTFFFPYNQGDLFESLYQSIALDDIQYLEEGIQVICKVNNYYKNIYEDYIIK